MIHLTAAPHVLAVLLLNAAITANASTFDVGDGLPFATIGSVPWEALQPGDTVRIHGRATPYREKWVIARQGTLAQPIRVLGVPGPGGALPIIDGENATTRLALDYWNEDRAVIKVGGASVPADIMPRFIEIANLDIRGARAPATFIDDAGGVQTYAQTAAALFIEKGENITVRNCTIRDSGNGLFIASSNAAVSRDILIESCVIAGNGNVGSGFEHNAYTAAIGLTVQFCRFGPLAPGALGNNFKDRSAGLVVRYNRIDGGNRQLDLVDAEDSSLIAADPRYRSTFVYGNVLVERDGPDNKQIVHYGGDSGVTTQYRKGVLYFYHNTLESRRQTSTTLFRLSTNDEHCDARNNVFFVTHAGSGLSILDSTGVIDLSHNYHRAGWIPASSGLQGVINDDGSSIVAPAPQFWNPAFEDYRLAPSSPCVDAAAALNPVVLPEYDLTGLFLPTREPGIRTRIGPALDVGAYEINCLGDLDVNTRVDISDLAMLLAEFGDPACATAQCAGDLDFSHAVDLSDLALFLTRFGLQCP